MTKHLNETIYFGGVEGGASYSKLSIFNGQGHMLGMSQGLGTNIWTSGIEEVANRLANLIREGLKSCKLPMTGTRLRCMCLSLSGAVDDEANGNLIKRLKELYPDVVEEYIITNDAMCPIATVSDSGGVVMISGTGSNCLLINPDGTEANCGGWGHIFGDEGSAYWIAYKAIKVYFDHSDNFEPAPHGYSTTILWNTIKDYFKVKERLDLLPHIYKNFDKSKFARLCKELSLKARDGDPLCKWIFERAGRMLAKHLVAISKKAHPSMTVNRSGGLPVVCAGSVWKSFDLLQTGFVKQLKEDGCETEMSLLMLKVPGSIGAVYLAAKHVDHALPKNYANNYTAFFNYKPATTTNIK